MIAETARVTSHLITHGNERVPIAYQLLQTLERKQRALGRPEVSR